jgi:hypothetical protein
MCSSVDRMTLLCPAVEERTSVASLSEWLREARSINSLLPAAGHKWQS